MNIGIFTDTYYPEINGVANSSYELKKGLENIKVNPIRNIRKRPAGKKQPLPVNPPLSGKARKKKRLQTGVAYGRF